MPLPEPLTAAEVNLTGMPFMPLVIERLVKSRAWLICKRRPELAFYLLNLWMRAWHEPGVSLEDDDDVLADAAMCSPEQWPALKADVLRGWTLCSDRRWHNPTVAKLAMEAWRERVAYRTRAADARAAKERKRSISMGSSVTEPVTGSVTGLPTDLKGQGEGQGQGQVDKKEPTPPIQKSSSGGTARAPVAPPKAAAAAAGSIGGGGKEEAGILAEIVLQIARIWPTHPPYRPHRADLPTIARWLSEGIAPDHIDKVASRLLARDHSRGGNPPSALALYLDGAVRETASSRPGTPPVLSEDQLTAAWRARLRGFAERRLWFDDRWGPAPGTGNCVAPLALLAEFKLGP